jgi:two-component system CheB/CheR fusion protein
MPRTERIEVKPTLEKAHHYEALEAHAPPSMLVDENHAVVNLSETAGRFVLHSEGPVSRDAAEIVRPELRLELRAALHRAFAHNQLTLTLPVPVRFNGTPQAVAIQVRPIRQDEQARSALVLFIEGGQMAELPGEQPPPGGSAAVIAKLRDELLATQTTLWTTREQYESATEELRAANEELQSINEEYRSTAEELETSKEELQSINEELQTVNNELKIKLEMVSRAHNDLQNLMSATDVATLFLDSGLRIKRFTSRIGDIFSIVPGDEGRPVTDFTHRLDYHDLIKDVQAVLADLVPIERTLRTADRHWYMMRLRPYRTMEDKIEGVVATFVDITERRDADAAWESRQQLLVNELAHRVKNTLAVVQALVRYTLRKSKAEPEIVATLGSRLTALAGAHDLLIESEWKGASLETLVHQQLAAFVGEDTHRIDISGAPLILPPAFATPLALIVHELATNAAKHGALRDSEGTVKLHWQVLQSGSAPPMLEIVWAEHCRRTFPMQQKRGLGSELIENAISGTEATFDWGKEGLTCTVRVPLSANANG